MTNNEKVIAQTTQWIQSVVIGCNFCPFAAQAMLRDSVRFAVLPDATLETSLEYFLEELRYCDDHEEVATTLVIFPGAFPIFKDYLRLVDLAEALSSDQDYDGIYQVASFHPEYCFAGAPKNDPANYTNRSIYPMLHILREDSLSGALSGFPDPEGIPQRNIDFAQGKGLAWMKAMRDACV